MKHTRNNYDKKNFQNFSKYLYQQFDSSDTDISIPTKREIQKLFLLMQIYTEYQKQNKKQQYQPPKKRQKKNIETKPYKWNASPTRENKHFQ